LLPQYRQGCLATPAIGRRGRSRHRELIVVRTTMILHAPLDRHILTVRHALVALETPVIQRALMVRDTAVIQRPLMIRHTAKITAVGIQVAPILTELADIVTTVGAIIAQLASIVAQLADVIAAFSIKTIQRVTVLADFSVVVSEFGTLPCDPCPVTISLISA